MTPDACSAGAPSIDVMRPLAIVLRTIALHRLIPANLARCDPAENRGIRVAQVTAGTPVVTPHPISAALCFTSARNGPGSLLLLGRVDQSGLTIRRGATADIRKLGRPSLTAESSASSAAMATDAIQHGDEMLRRGFTIAQVVHDYGDVCQAISGSLLLLGRVDARGTSRSICS